MTPAPTRQPHAARPNGRYEPFYRLMGHEHRLLCSYMPASDQAETYAALLLGRLAFIYFLQQQGFLASNTRYLQDQLSACQETGSPFLRFLLQLMRRLSCQHTTLCDRVPKLHPALFTEHPLDHSSIPDEPFARILQHFENHSWHLTEPLISPQGHVGPPLAGGRGDVASQPSIYPDILEYSFTRFINQKQMGAYYTGEDITTYISQHAILAHLFEALQQRFDCSAIIQNLLSAAPERYLPPALLSPHRLPGESEREQQARRERCSEIYARMRSGQISSPHHFITCNLDSQRCALDLLARCDNSSLLRAFYETLSQVSILDPTCGSGVFLFAALTILEALYTACLAHMHRTLSQPQSLHHSTSQDLAFFRATLEQVTTYPNPGFFILRTIISHNLYGVDIMREAIETCKLRLLLRLMARLEQPQDLSWLPRTPMNLYPGNALVGFINPPHQPEITEQFLNREQARQAGLDPANTAALRHWQASHQPLHWCLTFKTIMERGGFDVIIGNPPYVEYSKARQYYSVPGRECGNLYAAVIERSLALCRENASYLGLIVPLSLCGGERFARLRAAIRRQTSHLWLANFDIFPCRLFDGAFQRLSILLVRHSTQSPCAVSVTGIKRWHARERPHLIDLVSYTPACCDINPGVFPKLASPIQEHILRKVTRRAASGCIGQSLHDQPTPHFVYYQEATNYWLKATCRVPYYRKNGVVMPPSHGRFLYLEDERTASTIMALMNSSLFYIWFATFSDGFHLSHALVKDFPLNNQLYALPELPGLAQQLQADIQRNATLSTRNTRAEPGINKTQHRIELEEFRMSLSKPLLDAIDRVLADHYGLTEQELDFVIHYDIKYRMGLR
ncbi:MAG: Eco57I restriction-modification methylase domain-containing protein [Ktedonobacteraceae bacterium]|nr:Eco57I restriction-modification methylase domain-containing protein [Ktedonobacteraceae bacterium]